MAGARCGVRVGCRRAPPASFPLHYFSSFSLFYPPDTAPSHLGVGALHVGARREKRPAAVGAALHDGPAQRRPALLVLDVDRLAAAGEGGHELRKVLRGVVQRRAAAVVLDGRAGARLQQQAGHVLAARGSGPVQRRAVGAVAQLHVAARGVEHLNHLHVTCLERGKESGRAADRRGEKGAGAATYHCPRQCAAGCVHRRHSDSAAAAHAREAPCDEEMKKRKRRGRGRRKVNHTKTSHEHRVACG